jgi:hypothetical protein
MNGSTSTTGTTTTRTTRSTRTRRLVLASWLMLPLALLTFAAAYVTGEAMMRSLDVAEGELLWSAGPAGWAAAVLVMTLMVLPLLAGAGLAWAARRQGDPRATAPLVVHGVLAVWLVGTQLFQAVVSAFV